MVSSNNALTNFIINNFFSWIFSHLPAILAEWFIPVIPSQIIIIIINFFSSILIFILFVCFLFPLYTSAVFVIGHSTVETSRK